MDPEPLAGGWDENAQWPKNDSLFAAGKCGLIVAIVNELKVAGAGELEKSKQKRTMKAASSKTEAMMHLIVER